jgi:hypothetical protein
VVAGAASDAEVVAQIRQLPQYKARFPALYRADGTMRMTEAEYISTEDAYRKAAKRFGRPDTELDSPNDFKSLIENEVDPNEFTDRLKTYDAVKQGGQDMIDAFYVYAGMRVGVDDLYQMVVDPTFADKMTTDYNQRVAAQPFDYETWVTRATEAGLSRVASQLTELERQGVITGDVIQKVTQTDSKFARQIVDALYHEGAPTDPTKYLNLNELMSAFEEAALGAAAKGVGLEMPDKARVAELRAAGIDRAKARSAYSDFATYKNQYAGMVERLTQGAQTFGQSDFENAALLGKGDARSLLEKATAQEKSYGQSTGGVNFSQDKSGRFQQRGFAPV